MLNNKKIVILGGGTNTYISNHLALSAPAYGTTAKILANKFRRHEENKMEVDLYLTKMASSDSIHLGRNLPDTPEEIEELVDKLIADPATRVIIFNVAMVDYKPTSLFTLESNSYDAYNPREITDKFGKYASRLNTSKLPEVCLELSVQDKIIQKIRKERKDILLVGFKTTCGAIKEEQFQKGLKLCKDASANIVFVNDVDKDRISELQKCIEYFNKNEKPFSILKEKIDAGVGNKTDQQIYVHYNQQYNTWLNRISRLQNNGLVTPEESSYWYNTRDEALDALVQMVLNRVKGEFVRTTVVERDTISWGDTIIPQTFKDVFNHIRSNGGWHVNVKGKTSGHFGIKINQYESICSIRKQNYNDIENVGMVKVITENDKVVAFGAKPSVGDATQRELFRRYPRYDCIIHFHSSLKISSRSVINIANQFNFECGSTGNNDSCAYNTTTNMKEYVLNDGSRIHAVHLDHHGPNIMFSSKTNPNFINQFINEHWNIDKQTTGLTDEYK